MKPRAPILHREHDAAAQGPAAGEVAGGLFIPVLAPSLAEGEAAMLAVILASGTLGLSRRAIAGKSCRTVVTTERIMRSLRDLGLIEATAPKGGPKTRWGAPGTRARYEAEHSEAMRLARERRAARDEKSHKASEPWREPVRYASVWDYARQGGAA